MFVNSSLFYKQSHSSIFFKLLLNSLPSRPSFNVYYTFLVVLPLDVSSCFYFLLPLRMFLSIFHNFHTYWYNL